MKNKYAEYKKNKEDLIQTTVDSWNKAWNSQVGDPGAIFDPTKFNFIMQKQAADAMKGAAYKGDIYEFIDEKDFAKFQQIHTLLESGGVSHFRQQLVDYMNLTDTELGEAFPNQTKEIKSGKIRERIQSFINNIDQVEENYKRLQDEFQNPYDSSIYDKGTS